MEFTELRVMPNKFERLETSRLIQLLIDTHVLLCLVVGGQQCRVINSGKILIQQTQKIIFGTLL